MKIECCRIYVDCQENDPVDIKCGGPACLGYDFLVDKSKVDEMMDFIKETCNKLDVPILALYCDKWSTIEKEQEKVWTKERIYKCIERNEAGLNFRSINTL